VRWLCQTLTNASWPCAVYVRPRPRHRPPRAVPDEAASLGAAPDLLFLAKEHLGRLRESHIEGPADLVVEIVSKESRGRDRGEKFYEYAEGGVPEYWLLDPQLEQAEFYQLDAQGRYQMVAPDDSGIYHAKVVAGFWLRVAWLWHQPLPDPVQVLLEIDRDAYRRYLHTRIQQAGS
jgi:Uma2 family endonuclease